MKAKRYLSILLCLLMVGIYIPAAGAATGVNAQGRTTAEIGDQLFFAVTATSGTALNRVPLNGGAAAAIESQMNIEDLVTVGDTLYYLRYDAPVYQLVSTDKDGEQLSILHEFEDQEIMKLSYYDGILYCLVNGVLTLVDPEDGTPDALNTAVTMSDYVIVNDVVFYVSESDTEEYTATSGELSATESAGTLWSMSITGTNPEVVLDKGVRDLKAYGNYVYFHNYEDNYLTSSAEGQAWMEGKLYRMNTETNQIASMNLSYDWDYYVTQYGVVVYTSGDISLYPLAGGPAKKLMSAGSLTMVSTSDANAYAYDYDKNSLTMIPLAGGATKSLATGVKINPAEETKTVEYQVGPDGELITDDQGNPIPVEGAEPEGVGDPDTTDKTALPKSDGYIFPNSATEKLTEADLQAVDGELWELGRMEILARHGYEFNTNSVQQYFNGKSWYVKGGYKAGCLDAIETYNNNLLKKRTGGVLGRSLSSSDASKSSSSSKTGGYIFPNSKTKRLTRSEILNVSKSKWGYGRNEILARHGYKFETKKYRDYFNGKSWYKSGGYSRGELSSVEWDNMDLIKALEKEYGLLDSDGRSTGGSSSGRIKLSKNVFSSSSTKELTASQLKDLSASKLATARNEILARHGYPFKQAKWKSYFKGTGWKASSSYSYSKLNSIEKRNIELIKKYENKK